MFYLSFAGKYSRAIKASFLFVLIASLLAVSLTPPSTAEPQPIGPLSSKHEPSAEFVPGEIMVRYRTEAHRTAAAPLRISGAEVSLNIERPAGFDIVKGLRHMHVSTDRTLDAIAALRAQPDVLYAEPVYVRHASVTPNDPRFTDGSLYGLTKIGADQAWNTTTGNNNVVVAVIDQGINVSHPDLAANIWVNPGEIPGNGIDDDGNGFIDDINGYDFVHNTGVVFPPTSMEEHATHVAGTIGAVGNNGIGVVGV
jgi:subtilisin family serine protease